MTFEELPKPIPIGKAVDYSGVQFGDLTCLFRVENNGKSRRPMWACRCSCGEYCVKPSDGLVNGNSHVCDLYKHENMVGKKFGHLIVVKRTNEYEYKKKWKYLCLCDCGNTELIPVWDITLRYGHITSCGCARIENITNQKFGMLTALRPTKQRKGSSVVWECLCDCGDITYKSERELVMGICNSCPKHHISIGEIIIKNILDDYKISYIHDKSYSNCIFPDSNHKAKFDFYLKKNKEFIEFDGSQHFDYTGTDWNTKEKFLNTHNHDLFKNQWAWINNIPMKRIPYNYKGDLTFERVISDEFLITPQTHPEWYPPKDSSYPYFTLEDIDKLKEVS